MKEKFKYFFYWAGFGLIQMYLLITKNFEAMLGLFLLDWIIRSSWEYLPSKINKEEKKC